MSFQTVNPFTNELVASFPSATEEEIDAAIAKADTAFQSWKDKSVAERVAPLAEASRILKAETNSYAQTITLEMGKVIGEAEAETILSADILQYYVDNAAAFLEPRDLPVAGSERVQLLTQPLGVIYVIEPWNFPYYQIARIIAPQLAAGNTVILKHAGNVPQSALRFEKLMLEAGLPEGVFINLFADHDKTQHILDDPRVRGVALTGSERAGAAVAEAAGKALKKSTLELGGSDAFIVLDDADVAKAAKWAAFGRHWNAGQVCVSSKRLIVVDAVYDEFLATYKAEVAKLVAGDPFDRATTLAPLSTQKAADDLKGQLDRAVAAGAVAEDLGVTVPAQGAFFAPTLLTNITKDNPAFHQEFFGPVTHLFRVADEAEAIDIANDSPYGLGGSVFTEDEERGKRVAAQIETGMVFINHPTGVKADIPFGGVKNSGYGHELIDLGFTEFTNQKVVALTDIDGAF